MRARKPLRATMLALSMLFNPAWVRIDVLRDAALSWHIPAAAPLTRGARLYMDAPPGGGQLTAIVRSIMRTNPRLSGFDALVLAAQTVRAAERHGIDSGFLAATLLQESAFTPDIVSWAGAAGIGQFMVGTADDYGIDPFDAPGAIDATARLLSAYVARYSSSYDADPYALAMAAYNAGPAAVSAYGGIPPYKETREYIADIRERWSRIVRDR